MQRIPDMSGDSLVPFGYENIKPSYTVITDCWKGYNMLRVVIFPASRAGSMVPPMPYQKIVDSDQQSQ